MMAIMGAVIRAMEMLQAEMEAIARASQITARELRLFREQPRFDVKLEPPNFRLATWSLNKGHAHD